MKALLDNEWDNYLEAHPEETAGKQTAPGEVDETAAAEAAAAARAAVAAEAGDAADDGAVPAKEPAAGEDANAN